MAEKKREPLKMDFPSNSHKDKVKCETKDEPKKVNKVITGTVVKRKKSLGKRFIETFVGEDIGNVKDYIIHDVLIPSGKDVITDIVKGIVDTVQGTIEVALYGERKRSSSNRDRGRSYVSYNNYSSRDRDRDKREDRRDISARGRARHNFDEIVLTSRGEAEEVLSHLVDLTIDYGQATVSDLYDLVGITEAFTDNKYGWKDLSSASTSRIREGYVLNLPKPVLLD